MTVQLRATVGNGQANHPEDVATVQLLMSTHGVGEVAATGVFDPATAALVAAFQRHHLGFTDGVVGPGDITFNRMRGAADPDQLVEAQTDMMLRAMALHFSTGSTAEIGDVPLDFIRPTADGQGFAGQWIVEGSATGIYSHPRFGTWDVRGAILIAYRAVGEEASALGNPISGERAVPPGAVSWFEHGRLVFHADSGVVEQVDLTPV